MKKVIKIGQFAGGSFGVMGHPNESYMYYAVEGDVGSNGFFRFASRHKKAVEAYARRLQLQPELDQIKPTGLRNIDAIVLGLKEAALDAASNDDRKHLAEIRKMLAEILGAPRWGNIPHHLMKYAKYS